VQLELAADARGGRGSGFVLTEDGVAVVCVFKAAREF
jgi:hypothetical protein